MNPTNPGPTPIIEGGTSLVEISMQQNAHKEHRREYKDHNEVSNASKILVTGTLEEKYLRHLKSNYAGFMNVSIHQIFENVHATFGNITNLDLK